MMNALNEYNHTNQPKKVFELAPVKGPEEAEREFVREIAPKIRRHAHFDADLSAGAKFFFDALLDLSFMHCYGGSGKGKLFSTVKDLARLLKHDRKSIVAWRDELAAPRWIWYRDEWPICEWRICALCPAPETDTRGTEYQMSLGRAAGKSPGADFLANNGHSTSKVQEIPTSDTKDSPQRVETFHTQSPKSPHAMSSPFPLASPKSPQPMTKDSPQHVQSLVTDVGKVSTQQRENLDTNKETPRSSGALGAIGGVTSAPPVASHGCSELTDQPDGDIAKLAKWRESLNGSFPSRLEKLLARLIDERKQERAPNRREFLAKKIAMLKEILDGPLPAPEPPAPKTPTQPVAAPKPKTEAELEAELLAVAKETPASVLTPKMKRLLEKDRQKK